jgi:hypothetical protein
MEAAKDYFTWLADHRRDKFGSGSEGKIAWLKSMLPEIGKVSDRIERLVIAGEVANYIGITEKQALEEFRKAVNGRRTEMAPAAPAAVSTNEKLLLRLLLANPDAPDALIPGLKDIVAIAQMPTRRIFEALFGLHEAGARIGFNEIHDRLSEEDRALLAATVLLDETNESEQSIEQGIACLRSLNGAEIESQRAALKARIKEAGRNGDMQEALRLSEELDRIKRINQANK